MKKFEFPKRHQIPAKIRFTYGDGQRAYLVPFPLKWTSVMVVAIYLAFRLVDWSHFKKRSVVNSTAKLISGHLDRARQEWYMEMRISFLIVTEDGTILGSIAATDINKNGVGTAILGWAVIRGDYSGCGVMTCAGKALIEWLRSYGFKAVGAHISTENPKSEALASRLGLSPKERTKDINAASGHVEQQNLWWLDLAA